VNVRNVCVAFFINTACSLFKETPEESPNMSGADVNAEECWERVSVKVEVKE
jgi:hypothetical protein